MNKFVILAFFALAVGALADSYAKPEHKGYAAPAHHAPAHHGYAAPAHHGHGYGHGHGHAAPVVHSYPVHAPHVKCGASLLVGCAPSVAHAPCHPVHEKGYGKGHGYGHEHGHGHGHAAHGYRAPESDSFDQFEE